MGLIAKALALGMALLMVGCGGVPVTYKNDYYRANGKADDQFAYERDEYECKNESLRSTIKTKNDGSIRGTYYSVDKSQYRACMRVRGWREA